VFCPGFSSKIYGKPDPLCYLLNGVRVQISGVSKQIFQEPNGAGGGGDFVSAHSEDLARLLGLWEPSIVGMMGSEAVRPVDTIPKMVETLSVTAFYEETEVPLERRKLNWTHTAHDHVSVAME
jgi:hypothetical protein